MRILVLLLFFCLSAQAAFVSVNIGDSRLQSSHWVSDPSGIVGFSLEAGFFNETSNLIDYKLSFDVKRFGYSYDDGDEAVSFWTIGFKPFTWSVTYKNIMFEAYPSISWIFAWNNVNRAMEEHSFNETFDGRRFCFGYGYRLGYYLNENLFLGLNADYRMVYWNFHGLHGGDDSWMSMGGWGLSAQWNF